MNDNIEITILPDGTLKIETDKVSMPNHKNAEELLQWFARMTGGESKRVRKPHAHANVHQHEEAHQ